MDKVRHGGAKHIGKVFAKHILRELSGLGHLLLQHKLWGVEGNISPVVEEFEAVVDKGPCATLELDRVSETGVYISRTG